jgi:hypothetical protein
VPVTRGIWLFCFSVVLAHAGRNSLNVKAVANGFSKTDAAPLLGQRGAHQDIAGGIPKSD